MSCSFNKAMSKRFCSIIYIISCGISSIVKDCKGFYLFSSKSVVVLKYIFYEKICKGPLSIIKKKETIDNFHKKLSGCASAQKILELHK